MKTLFIKLIFVLVICISQSAYSEIWAEREAIAKIESELAALEFLIITAENQSNPEDRTTFNYEVLLNDLRKIRTGINSHLMVPMNPVDSSTIDALSAVYTEHQK